MIKLRRGYYWEELSPHIAIKEVWLVASVISILLLASVIITPAFATRNIEVMKEVDVRKDLLEKTLTDLTSYKKIFPTLIKDVKIDPSDKSKAKFIVEAVGTREANVKSTVNPDGTFIVDIISGELKGSKIITTLKERVGFDGTPNGATTVKTTLRLETDFLVSMALGTVDNSQIEKWVGDGFYDLGQYIKVQYPQSKQEQVEVDYKKKAAPKLEAAKKLDPQKEELKTVTKTQKAIPKYEAAKKLDLDKKPKELSSFSIQNAEQMPKIKDDQVIKKNIQTVPKTKSYAIMLDSFFTTSHIGDTMTFSGTLQLAGANPKGAVVYIKDEDPFGADDILASGFADSNGRFNIKWNVRNMDFDGTADVYAIYEGSDLHPQLKTCNFECKNTIKLIVLD